MTDLGILRAIRISTSQPLPAGQLEFTIMTKTKTIWTKPTLVRLGKIGNVAGTKAVGADGGSAQPKS